MGHKKRDDKVRNLRRWSSVGDGHSKLTRCFSFFFWSTSRGKRSIALPSTWIRWWKAERTAREMLFEMEIFVCSGSAKGQGRLRWCLIWSQASSGSVSLPVVRSWVGRGVFNCARRFRVCCAFVSNFRGFVQLEIFVLESLQTIMAIFFVSKWKLLVLSHCPSKCFERSDGGIA